MNPPKLYDEITIVISDRARAKDPKKMAFAMYLQIREHPETIKKADAWKTMLKIIKDLLSQHFGWSMMEIHALFTRLNNLTKYMEKSS